MDEHATTLARERKEAAKKIGTMQQDATAALAATRAQLERASADLLHTRSALMDEQGQSQSLVAACRKVENNLAALERQNDQERRSLITEHEAKVAALKHALSVADAACAEQVSIIACVRPNYVVFGLALSTYTQLCPGIFQSFLIERYALQIAITKQQRQQQAREIEELQQACSIKDARIMHLENHTGQLEHMLSEARGQCVQAEASLANSLQVG